jgi:predicted TIM-barrel fold metal-dependent hydrolase
VAEAIVDVHSHFYPRWYVELLKARTELPRIAEDENGAERFVIFPGEYGRPMDREYWDLDAKLSFMDGLGITQTVLSLGNPWLDPFTGPDAVDIARRLNSDFATLGARTGGRIVGMGALPSADVDGAVVVAEEIGATPTLYGLVVGTLICGRTFDDPELRPIWSVLESTGTPIFVHPHRTAAAEDLEGFGHAFPVGIGFPFETTIALARLVYAGVLQEFPDLQFVASHGGGTIPFLAGRLDAAWKSDPSVHERLPSLPSLDLAKLAYDAVLYHPGAMLATSDLVGTELMAFGTDHPFSVSDPSSTFDALSVFDEVERKRVLSETAQRIFEIPTL